MLPHVPLAETEVILAIFCFYLNTCYFMPLAKLSTLNKLGYVISFLPWVWCIHVSPSVGKYKLDFCD